MYICIYIYTFEREREINLMKVENMEMPNKTIVTTAATSSSNGHCSTQGGAQLEAFFTRPPIVFHFLAVPSIS
jgi:hypothetical protein